MEIRIPVLTYLPNTIFLLASKYPSVLKMILEFIQNSLDEGASRIWLVYNMKLHKLIYRDNGKGADLGKMKKVLSSIALSLKGTGEQMGRWGIGLVSPADKCDRFEIEITSDESPDGFHRYAFDFKKIAKDGFGDGIVAVRLQNLRYVPVGQKAIQNKTAVNHRAQFTLFNVVRDRTIANVDPEELKSQILSRFKKPLRDLKTVVSVRIIPEKGKPTYDEFTASGYEGLQLPVHEVFDQNAGKVRFNIFLSPKPEKTRIGKVDFGEVGNPFRIDTKSLVKGAAEHLTRQAAEILLSGVFEGEVAGEQIEIAATRDSLKLNDAAIGFYKAIEHWCTTIGKQHVAEVQEKLKDENLQATAISALRFLEGFISSHVGDLMDAAKMFKVGVSDRETEGGAAGNPVTVVKRSRKKKRVDGGEDQGVDSTEDDSGTSSGQQKKQNQSFFTVSKPGGSVKRVISHRKLGLQFSHEILPSTKKLWEFDETSGTIRVNVKNPTWVMCEGNPSAMTFLHVFVGVQALGLYTMQLGLQDEHRKLLDMITDPVAQFFAAGEEFVKRK